MTFYRRLPHVCETEPSAFLTWRLHDSLPSHQAFPLRAFNSGQAFAATDRLLDQARDGSLHLRQPAVADMVEEALETATNICRLHAYVVMPNHIHLLATPTVPLPELTESLRTLTAARSKAMLDLAEGPFWHEESYVRMVRYGREFDEIRNYIEENPVRAGLAREAGEYLWSSAGRMAQGIIHGMPQAALGPEVRLTAGQ
jgi:REP-associated tyrosine transposase